MQTKLIDLLNKFFPKSTVKRESSHYIPYGTHSIYEEDINEVCKVLKHKKITQGDTVPKFEEAISQKVSAKHAVALNSATSALHLSLAALGLKKGDEVIVPAFTWISTANVVEHLGAKVVFCDIDLASW